MMSPERRVIIRSPCDTADVTTTPHFCNHDNRSREFKKRAGNLAGGHISLWTSRGMKLEEIETLREFSVLEDLKLRFKGVEVIHPSFLFVFRPHHVPLLPQTRGCSD